MIRAFHACGGRLRFAPMAVVFLLIVSFSINATAQDTTSSPHSLTYRNLVAARLNPLGLVDALSVDYQYRLYESDSPLFRNNYVGLSLLPILSPAYFRGGVGASVQPLSILRLGVTYEWIGYFGTFKYLQSYPDAATAEYSETAIDEREDAAYSTTGSTTSLTALLQMKVGSIAARSNFKLMYVNMSLNDGDTVWYDILMDVLMPQSGWAWTNDADVLYLTNFGLIAGLRYSVTQVQYEEEITDDPNVPIHRIGPLISYELSSNKGEMVDQVSVFTLINWYVKHRYRTGEEVSQAVPYIAIGMSVTGNLL